jgi:hypothetical protein
MNRPRSLTPPPGAIVHGLDLVARNALRWVAGLGRAQPGRPAWLFAPSVDAITNLRELGLIEPHPDHDGEHRPTQAGVELLPKIGARG